jgi:hypothetical protein
MAITVVGTAIAVDTGSITVDTVTMPTGIAAGDGALLFFGYASGAITTTITDNGLSSPFTQVGATATFSGHQSQVWSVQNLVAADSGKVITLTQSAAVKEGVVLVVYRGVSKTAMVNAFASKTSTVGTTTPTIPTTATTAGGCVEIGLLCSTRGASSPQISTVTPPAGTTIGVSSFAPTAGATGQQQSVVSVEGHNLTALTSGTTIGGDTFTTDVAAAYSAWTLALAPSSTGPIVDAGADQTVPSGATVTLSGSETAATGTTIASRAWSFTSSPGTAPTLTGGTTATASFTAATAGTYVLRYRVTDSAGIFNDSTVTVYATTANARPNNTPSTGGWTAVGATTIHAALADEVATTYAETSDNPQGDTFVVDLPPAPVGAKTVFYDVQASAAAPVGSLLVEYLSGTTVVASWTEAPTTAVIARTRVLTDAQNALVKDPNHRQLRFTGTAG